MLTRPFRIALVQEVLAHYREPLFTLLDASRNFEFTFFTGGVDVQGITHLRPGSVTRQRIASVRTRPFYWQSGVVALGLSREFDALVLAGNPHYLSTWIAAALARLRGLPVIFWTHGWLRRERGVRKMLRMSFYRLANTLIVYNERAKRLGVEAGYPSARMVVVYNSLDLQQANAVISAIARDGSAARMPTAMFANPERPLVICTARLTSICRFDLLLQAAARLQERGNSVNVLLVGDGPMRGELEELAGVLEISAHFAGAVYDEEQLGRWLYHSDLTVSPGKVGLTAIHSLMYGTPVITHGDLDRQMPEVETVIDGETGAFFRQGDADDLANVIEGWLSADHDRSAVRARCRAAIMKKWNPDNQSRLIEGAIMELLQGREAGL